MSTYPSGNTTPMSRRRAGGSSAYRNRGKSSVPGNPGRHQVVPQHDDQGNMIDDSDIVDFTTIINKLGPDDWREKTKALEDLVKRVPDFDSGERGILHWYKSPPTLRRLSFPLSTMLLDQRSSVVKHTTRHIALLVDKTNCFHIPDRKSQQPQSNGSNDDFNSVLDKDDNKKKTTDLCKYLMKDLLPTILSLHGQTVNVIKDCTTNMMLEIISLCRFKSGLPILLEKLRKEKSRDVREACVRYLKAIIECWHHTLDHGRGQTYLTRDVCIHIGNAVARALMDPSQLVRQEARLSFEIFRGIYPTLWYEIVYKPDGIFHKDPRIQKSLINAALRADAEKNLNEGDVSVTQSFDFDDTSSVGSMQSKGSNVSRISIHSSRSIQSKLSNNSRMSNLSRQSRSSRSIYSGYNKNSNLVAARQHNNVPNNRPGSAEKYNPRGNNKIYSPRRPTTPSNIPSPQVRGNLGSPMIPPLSNGNGYTTRQQNTTPQKLFSNELSWKAVTNIQAAFRGYSTRKSILNNFNAKKERSTPNQKTHISTISRPPLISPSTQKGHLGKTAAMMARRRQSISAKDACPPVPPSPGMNSVGSFNSQSDFVSPPPNQRPFFSDQSPHTPRVLNVTTAKEMSCMDADAVIARAKSRKSSIMLQRRLKRNAGNNNSREDSTSLNSSGETPSSQKNETISENIVIAHQLLTAHKCYIDELMEGLKAEMDCIRDFEFLLDPDENGRNTLGPTEDQVLSYFESVVQFLDRGTDNGNKLRRTIDKICRAEPTQAYQPSYRFEDSPSSMGRLSNATPPTEI